MTTLIQNPTRILFFTGKGGVGKTSSACATAIGLAEAGKRVLLVSTDPASNLDEVLGVKLSNTKTQVPTVSGLWALNIDPEQAAHDYRERVVGPYRRGAAGGGDHQHGRAALGRVHGGDRGLRRVLQAAGGQGVVEKLTSRSELAQYRVNLLPAVVVDGRVVHAGGIPTKAEVQRWVQELQP